jgi:hypothetical protein
MDTKKLGKFWVFRDGRKEIDGCSLLREFLQSLDKALVHPSDATSIIDALLMAGQLESAMADAGSATLSTSQQATDLLADLLAGSDFPSSRAMAVRRALDHAEVSKRLTISPPEGFAYYALHPCDFVKITEQVSPASHNLAVVGIRTIGTTLSAIVASALRRSGKHTTRITVRPSGHPYDRTCTFNDSQSRWISQQLSRDADFLVVDEGPGRSGSSFLSVAEAAVSMGVPRERITLLGSRPVAPASLCAHNAVTRWSQFRFLSPVMNTYERFRHDFYVGGGDWRNFFEPTTSWPECWPQMERLKFLSADRRRLYKFEGFGRFGKEVLEKANRLARGGFAPLAEDADDGMISYAVINGHRPAPDNVSRELLEQIAQYCAFRVHEFSCGQSPRSQLGEMTRFNLEAQFGSSAHFESDLLETSRPVLVDARMQPHEWLLLNGEKLIKLDGTTHGDDHFFPGPTDIAWDLAGTIVEWALDQDATDFLLNCFLRASGDDARRRIHAFVLAYTMFRLGYCAMAMTTVSGTAEEQRLQTAFQRYERLAAMQRNSALASRTELPGLSVTSAEPAVYPSRA